MDKNLYDLLGVDKDVSNLGLKIAYRKLASTMHPDKNPEANPDEWVAIQVAYDTLKDTKKRARYDETGEAEGITPADPEKVAAYQFLNIALDKLITQAMSNGSEQNLIKKLAQEVANKREELRETIKEGKKVEARIDALIETHEGEFIQSKLQNTKDSTVSQLKLLELQAASLVHADSILEECKFTGMEALQAPRGMYGNPYDLGTFGGMRFR